VCSKWNTTDIIFKRRAIDRSESAAVIEGGSRSSRVRTLVTAAPPLRKRGGAASAAPVPSPNPPPPPRKRGASAVPSPTPPPLRKRGGTASAAPVPSPKPPALSLRKRGASPSPLPLKKTPPLRTRKAAIGSMSPPLSGKKGGTTSLSGRGGVTTSAEHTPIVPRATSLSGRGGGTTSAEHTPSVPRATSLSGRGGGATSRSITSGSVDSKRATSSTQRAEEGTPLVAIKCEGEDASLFSSVQLIWMKANDGRRFKQLDFINCSNTTLFTLFPSNRNKHDHPIPAHVRHSARDIRRFRLCGSTQQLHIIASPPPPPRNLFSTSDMKCMGLPLSFISALSPNKDVMAIGYNNIIREAMRKRIDLIRDGIHPDLHHHHGVVLHKNNNALCFFILDRIIGSKDEFYNSMFFRTYECDPNSMSNDSIQCSSCFLAKKKLQRICLNSLKIRDNCGLRSRNSVLSVSLSLIVSKVEKVAKVCVAKSKRA